MTFLAVSSPAEIDRKQGRLLQLAALFLFLYSVTLSLAPAVRLHSWQVDYRWNHWIGFAVWLVGIGLVHRQLGNRFPERDPLIFPIVGLLCGWGLLTIWRLDAVMGARQTIWLAIGLLVFAGGLRVTNLLVLLRRYKYLWLTGGLLLTALTFLFGTYPGGEGPRLWLGCCGVYLQPSEPLKLLLIVYLAAYLADRLPISFGLTQLLPPTLILVGAALALLATQRDLGTASLFILIYTVVVYLASRRRRVLIISLLILAAAGVGGYLLFDVVRVRVDAWINPWVDPSGRSFQIVQSLLAVAEGGFLGRGPGLGSPGVVPVTHSDFIFASLAEEAGLLGTIGLLLLYALIVNRGFRVALYASNNYRRYLAAGMTAYLVMQAILIIGGNLRLLPLTGVTLPFVSYGGSSLLTALIAVVILIQAGSPEEEEEVAPAQLPSPIPYLVVSGGLLASLAALALINGWWSVVRIDALLSRTDNPRRWVNERFVPRGALLDRGGEPIASTQGQPGSYQRVYAYPPLSDTIGYNSPRYGQAGLEAGLDPYLRGVAGIPSSTIWLDNLLYGQTPPGLNVRLNIDLRMQQKADQLLDGHKGALVLVNANSGEILAIASHPNFDPNRLEDSWNDLLQNPDAPLFNRATQGQYPPGAALGPFLLAYLDAKGQRPEIPEQLSYSTSQNTYPCAVQPAAPLTPAGMITSGCPGPLAFLSRDMRATDLEALFSSLGFFETPSLPLPIPSPSQREIQQIDLAAIGQENLTVTPLQMALAAAALSNNGLRPSPKLAEAVYTPGQGWVLLDSGPVQKTLLAGGTAKTLETLASPDKMGWQVVAQARSNKTDLTWFIGGNFPQKQGTTLALALILEEPDAAYAQQVGQSLLNGLR